MRSEIFPDVTTTIIVFVRWYRYNMPYLRLHSSLDDIDMHGLVTLRTCFTRVACVTLGHIVLRV